MASNLIFSRAQTFYIDPISVDNSSSVSLTSIDLYFKTKPATTNNASGIAYPGITLYIANMGSDGNPDITNLDTSVYARVEYNNINVSDTATASTNFVFTKPITVTTGFQYAFIIKYDGNQEYDIWVAKRGDYLVNNNQLYSGSAGKYIGTSYTYTSPITPNTNGIWNPNTEIDLKFQVYCAKYYGDTSVGNTNKSSYVLAPNDYEFFTFDKKSSLNITNVFPGELAYQVTYYNQNTIPVFSNNSTITSGNVNWNTIYNNSNTNYIVLTSGNTTNIRKVISINSNTSITLDNPPTFNNSSAQFMISPVGKIYLTDISRFSGYTKNVLILSKSNANTTLKFSNNTVLSVNIVSGGTGYSNTDTIYVTKGGLNNANVTNMATLSLTTNSTGGIISANLTNNGSGYYYSPTYTILNSSNGASSGSSSSLTFNIGSAVKTELSNAYFSNTTLISFDISGATVLSDLTNPSGMTTQINENFLYYTLNDGIYATSVISGGSAYVNTDSVVFTSNTGSNAYATITTDSTGTITNLNIINPGINYTTPPTISVTSNTGSGANLSCVLGVGTVYQYPNYLKINTQIGQSQSFDYSNTLVLLSKSVEVMQSNVTYTATSGVSQSTDKSSMLEWYLTTNNLYVSPSATTSNSDVYMWKYIINNNYNGENTGSGNAYSKHITNVINFANNTFAEDLRVYVTAYTPAQTGIKVFAKLHNSKDPETFDMKEWTLLNNVAGNNTISTSNMIELSYGLPQYPNTAFTLNGTATTTNNSTTITGYNSNYNLLSNNNLVKIYSPLFPTNYMIASVNAVTNSTSFTINTPVTNNNILGSGFLVDAITYTHQGFNNFLNQNVVRYYNSMLNSYDTFDSFAIKIVLLSNSTAIVPKLSSVRAVGISA